MIIGMKDLIKLIGISIIACCAVFVCTLFLNYNIDITGLEGKIATEAGIAMYNAQVSMGKVTAAVTGGCLVITSVIMLVFYIKNYIDTHGKELGILKALGYSNIKIASHYTISFSENMQGNMEIMESSIKINPFLYCVAVYLVAPITEEFIFRGFIQTRLCRSMNAVPAILISSVLFAATHFMTGSISTVLFTFFGGILFGLTYKKTGCLLLTIIVHIVGNLSEILAAALISVMG